MTRVLALAVALWLAQPLVAHADTVTPRDYRERLTAARALVVQARSLSGAARDGAVTRARLLLVATTGLALPSGELSIDDGPLADRLTSDNASLDAGLALIDAQLALAARALAPTLDAARSDAALRDVLQAVDVSGA